jgi:mercuric ion transport protein
LAITENKVDLKQTGLSWLTLFASSGTLICCALPIILVTLGLGAIVAALTSSFPFLITIAQHKTWVFAGSGALLLLSGWLMFRPGRTCPADQELGRLCDQTQVWNRRIYWTSATLWVIGFFAAYLALPLRMLLDSQ